MTQTKTLRAQLESAKAEAKELRAKVATLTAAVIDLQWMARRYADGRSTYVPSTFNEHVRNCVAAGIGFKGPLFARDGMGRQYDGLTDEEAAAAERDM